MVLWCLPRNPRRFSSPLSALPASRLILQVRRLLTSSPCTCGGACHIRATDPLISPPLRGRGAGGGTCLSCLVLRLSFSRVVFGVWAGRKFFPSLTLDYIIPQKPPFVHKKVIKSAFCPLNLME